MAILFGKYKLKGRPAWWFHRLYHGAMVPTFNRKVRVFTDWTLAMFLKREAVGLSQMENPQLPIQEVTPPTKPVEAAKPAADKELASK